MATSPTEIMTIEELADYLKVSKSTLYKLVQHGGLPAQKIGKQWRFHKNAVDDWFREHPDRAGQEKRQ
jgi:excisionase family DNA binding protein